MRFTITADFINVYDLVEPPYKDAIAYYGISFNANQAPDELQRFRNYRTDRMYPKSKYAPLITLEDARYNELKNYFDICDMRNLSRDALLKGIKLDIEVEPFEFPIRNESGRHEGLLLKEVIIKFTQLNNPLLI